MCSHPPLLKLHSFTGVSQSSPVQPSSQCLHVVMSFVETQVWGDDSARFFPVALLQVIRGRARSAVASLSLLLKTS